MRNTFTISSIANVVSRFSVKAAVIVRKADTKPATWQHKSAGPIFGRGKPAGKRLLASELEPVLLGDASSMAIDCRCYSGNLRQPSSMWSRFLQPALRQALFQRIS